MVPILSIFLLISRVDGYDGVCTPNAAQDFKFPLNSMNVSLLKVKAQLYTGEFILKNTDQNKSDCSARLNIEQKSDSINIDLFRRYSPDANTKLSVSLDEFSKSYELKLTEPGQAATISREGNALKLVSSKTDQTCYYRLATRMDKELYDVDYPTRLEGLKQIAAEAGGCRNPLFIPSNPDNANINDGKGTEYGILGGINSQTLWQQESGRVNIPQWYAVNASLTVFPKIILDKIKATKKPNHESVCDSATVPDPRLKQTCEAWFDYLIDANPLDAAGKPISCLSNIALERSKKLWRAHGIAIDAVRAMPEYGKKTENIPLREFIFWKNWVDSVHVFEKTNIPTSDISIAALKAAVPPCVLGTPGCIESSFNPFAQTFVATILSNNIQTVNIYATATSEVLTDLTIRAQNKINETCNAAIQVRNGVYNTLRDCINNARYDNFSKMNYQVIK